MKLFNYLNLINTSCAPEKGGGTGYDCSAHTSHPRTIANSILAPHRASEAAVSKLNAGTQATIRGCQTIVPAPGDPQLSSENQNNADDLLFEEDVCMS